MIASRGIASLAATLALAGSGLANVLVAQGRTIDIVNGSRETLEFIEVTWSIDEDAYDVPDDETLEAGARTTFTFSEEQGCFFNVMAEGADGYYAKFLENFCTADEITLDATSFGLYEPGPGEIGVLDLTADAVLRASLTGFADLAPYFEPYYRGCADAPTAIASDPIDWIAFVCPNGSEMLGRAMGSGEWVFVQELESIFDDSLLEDDGFVESVAREYLETLDLRCGTLESSSEGDSFSLRVTEGPCAGAALVFEVDRENRVTRVIAFADQE